MKEEKSIIRIKSELFSEVLQRVIGSPQLTFKEITTVEKQGLYIIYEGDDIVYVGKTTRSGKVRIRELAADFRSHTFNKKLLSKRFKELGFVFKTLRNELKKEWIENGQISLDDFKSHQDYVNQHIRTALKFRFHPMEDEHELGRLEHFAIAIFDPLFNE
ncbi:hypothetical protein [Chitinophaga filiformis]|uniref:GIY-YIG domain-containing protein n=1 Tax=Chitinophaga filiformis TaxID=104663 RepID=A0A1G8AM61_CHIFI|nr:hypothetical protein [Chitinophaga filiformis]SDH22024.1 hypothetical protein SAMN04488121_109319 [Chitinophaga filiformis]